MNLLGIILRGIILSAFEDGQTEAIVNDGPPARFVVLHPVSGMTWSAFVPTGELVRVHREFRLLIQPVDHVHLAPLCCVVKNWVTQ